MNLMQDLLAIDNDELDDIKSMEELYDEIRDDPLFGRLFEIANVHTAEQFGLDVPEGVYEEMAGAIDDGDAWEEIRSQDWFASAQATAGEQSFFHWELEYPEVFFGEDGEKLDGAGFDAVVGNPPYVRQEQLSAIKPYLSSNFQSYESAADLYTYFLERSHDILKQNRSLGMIVSNKFIHAEYGSKLREYLSSSTQIRRAIDFHSLPVFGSEVSAYPLIFIVDRNEPQPDKEFLLGRMPDLDFNNLETILEDVGYSVEQQEFIESGWRIQNPEIINAINKIESESTRLVDYLSVSLRRGILTGLNEAFIIDSEDIDQFQEDSEHIYPLLKGKDVSRYEVSYQDRHLIAIPSGWTFEQSGCQSEEEAWNWFKSEYRELAQHLSNFESSAKKRHDRGECWWELRPCDYYNEFEQPKIVYPVISDGPSFAIDTGSNFINDKLYSIPREDYELLALLNSKLTYFWVKAELSGLRGDYQEFRAVHVEQIPIDKSISETSELENYGKRAMDLRNKRNKLNTSLLDHLGNYADGQSLADIGLTQPPAGAADSILQATTETYPNLRVGAASVVRESASTVEVRLTARYKPSEVQPEGAPRTETGDAREGEALADEVSGPVDDREPDQWGYVETDPEVALRITDLSEAEADLIEAFVPVAIEEAGGFADFRETATKTNSLVDRLRKLTLPAVADVESGLESYTETKESAR